MIIVDKDVLAGIKATQTNKINELKLRMENIPFIALSIDLSLKLVAFSEADKENIKDIIDSSKWLMNIVSSWSSEVKEIEIVDELNRIQSVIENATFNVIEMITDIKRKKINDDDMEVVHHIIQNGITTLETIRGWELKNAQPNEGTLEECEKEIREKRENMYKYDLNGLKAEMDKVVFDINRLDTLIKDKPLTEEEKGVAKIILTDGFVMLKEMITWI